MSEWLKKLRLAAIETVDKVPPGWKTKREIAKETGFSPKYIEQLLRASVEAGKIQRKTFKIQVGEFTRVVPHYK